MQNQILSDAVNQTAYARADVIEYYENFEPLFEAEKAIFEKLRPTIKDSKILELGIGGGRVTKHLLEISTDFVGLDYIAAFVEDTSRKYPQRKFLCGDARNLKNFEDETFDLVVFSFNGLDCVSPEDRLKVLSEVNRVLKKGGFFMFSSHNRDFENFRKLPWQQGIKYALDNFRFTLHCLYHLPNHFRMKKNEIIKKDYAVVNDGDHRFSLLIYYISIKNQIEQLRNFGFSDVEAYAADGKLVENDTSSHWIYYLARKK